MRATGRSVVTVLAGVVPWVVVRGADGSIDVVFSGGLLDPATGQLTTVVAYALVYTRGVPMPLLGWPIAALLWLVAVALALSGVALDREDSRLTAGLLVLAGLSLLPVAAAVDRPATVVAIPVGTAACWAAAWVGYGDAIRRGLAGGPGPER